MKDPTLSWLLDPKNPSVRVHTLIDLLHTSKDAKKVIASREKIPGYRPVKKILATQTSKGIWSPEDTCYSPKWTAAGWPLTLLWGVKTPPDFRICSVVGR